jgi:hypothetical protein
VVAKLHHVYNVNKAPLFLRLLAASVQVDRPVRLGRNLIHFAVTATFLRSGTKGTGLFERKESKFRKMRKKPFACRPSLLQLE